MKVNVRRHATAVSFYNHAAAFLLEREAINNIMIGVRDTAASAALFLATAEDDGVVVGAAMLLPDEPLLLSYCTHPDAPAALADALFQAGQPAHGARGPAPFSGAFAARWQALTGHTPVLDHTTRLYVLTEVTPPPNPVPGRLVDGSTVSRDLLYTWMRCFFDDIAGDNSSLDAERFTDTLLTQPQMGLFVWDDGGPVTMAGFRGWTDNGARIGMVYTPPEQRRKGYASACVAALSQHLLGLGRRYVCLYTDLDNPTSNHIYQVIGYQPVGDSENYVFRA